MKALLEEKFNIKDAKIYSSKLNNILEKDIGENEKKNEEVNHIKTSYINFLMGFFRFKPVIHSGEGFYNIILNEVNVYGEGDSLEIAKENLIDSIIEYINIYTDKINIFHKFETIERQAYMLKLIRCSGNREKLKKEVGL
ncbi:hypothetical protein ACJDU8_12580 [Clostridium sp. WILCCON 0269]|uniref:Uncharacterized protein n=1 Tax=Candidatus Clostridium eludens TaxID=3381663 RepID=A0ABW8SK48_9CLOT